MFVKIENYWGDKPLILNVDKIVCIELSVGKPYIVMDETIKYLLTEQQYNDLCEILTKRL